VLYYILYFFYNNITNKFFSVSDITTLIQTKEEKDYTNLSRQVTFLDHTFAVNTDNFNKLSPNTVVILDDYVFENSKESKAEFLHIVNYYLRHRHITLFLVIHNMYNIGLLNEILLAPHIILSYTNLGYYVLQKLKNRLGGNKVFEFWQESDRYNYHFCYINCNRNYLINNIEQLFLGNQATMFATQQKFIIHRDNESCEQDSDNKIVVTSNVINDNVYEYLNQTFPKNKNIHLVFKILLKHNLIDDTLFFSNFKNIHIADFCSFINNRFGKKETTNVNMVKLCKYLNNLKIRFPKISIKNPVAQNMLK
jgi:hypothetical protein